MLQTAHRQRYSQLPACNGSMCLRRLERSDPGLPRMPTTVVGLVSRQRRSPRAGSRRLLLKTGHADTTSPKQGASSINFERALQYRVRGAPVPTTRNRGANYSESTCIKDELGLLLKRDEMQPGFVSDDESGRPRRLPRHSSNVKSGLHPERPAP